MEQHRKVPLEVSDSSQDCKYLAGMLRHGKRLSKLRKQSTSTCPPLSNSRVSHIPEIPLQTEILSCGSAVPVRSGTELLRSGNGRWPFGSGNSMNVRRCGIS
jgi:hypothetical protein